MPPLWRLHWRLHLACFASPRREYGSFPDWQLRQRSLSSLTSSLPAFRAVFFSRWSLAASSFLFFFTSLPPCPNAAFLLTFRSSVCSSCSFLSSFRFLRLLRPAPSSRPSAGVGFAVSVFSFVCYVRNLFFPTALIRLQIRLCLPLGLNRPERAFRRAAE